MPGAQKGHAQVSQLPRPGAGHFFDELAVGTAALGQFCEVHSRHICKFQLCLLYTSDAADE